jgi:hypothetical protein
MTRLSMLILLVMIGTHIACDDTESAGSNLGTLELKGDWDKELPKDAHFDWAIFECPFSMPPADGDNEEIVDGKVHVVIEGIEPGVHCLLLFIDMNPDDGLMWIDGLDAAVYPEGDAQSIEVTIEKGKTTTLNLEFTILDQ